MILAIDLGTSGPKVALVTVDGAVVDDDFEPNEYILRPGQGVEQRPAEWWASIKAASKRLLARQAAHRDQIVALACTAHWSGTVAVDAAGQPLMNALIWMDARGAAAVSQRVSGGLQVAGYNLRRLVKWVRLTGGIPQHSGKDPVAHILYIKQHHPAIYAATHKFLEPKDYLNLRFTGKFASTYDAITLHWVTDNRDLTRVDYHPDLLRMAGLERDKLPDLIRAVDVLGPVLPAVAAEFGLPAGVQVIGSSADLQSAAVGSGAVRDYQMHGYIGTSAWVSCHLPRKKTNVLHNIASLPSSIPNRYFVGCEQETAGGCLRFLHEKLLPQVAQGVDHPYAEFDRLAATVPAGCDGLIFTPWLNGERSPVDEHTLRGGFFNLGLHHAQAHLVRAVLEGVAFNLRWLLGFVEKFAGQRATAINMIGGGAQSDVWCQILADILERPIRQVAHPLLANARGAAMLAAVGLGYTSFEAYGDRLEIAATYQPDPTRLAIYRPLYQEFVNIYRQNRAIYARLNR